MTLPHSLLEAGNLVLCSRKVRVYMTEATICCAQIGVGRLQLVCCCCQAVLGGGQLSVSILEPLCKRG